MEGQTTEKQYSLLPCPGRIQILPTVKKKLSKRCNLNPETPLAPVSALGKRAPIKQTTEATMQVSNGPANSHAQSVHHHCCLMLGSRLGTRAKGHNICKSAKPGPADVWETPCGDETVKSRSCRDVCWSIFLKAGRVTGCSICLSHSCGKPCLHDWGGGRHNP